MGSFKLKTILFVTAFVVSALMLYPPGMINEALFWDDKAYINNALIASGRASPSQVSGPHAEERPPLFWWLITAFFLLGAPIGIVRFISPTFGLLTVLAVFVFSWRIFRNIWTGFFSALLLSTSYFYILTSSYILSDAMGATLSILYILCLCLGFRERHALWLSGPFLAFSIMARDQNLLLIPATILMMIWIFFKRLTLKLMLSTLLISGLGLILTTISLEEVLQYISNIITPIVIDPLFFSLTLILSGLCLLLSITPPSIREVGVDGIQSTDLMFDLLLAFFSALSILYPYFVDNYRLSAEYQIVGRGVLSRPISHLMMARTGIGTELPPWAMRIQWIKHVIQFITMPILALAMIGSISALKKEKHTGIILTTWSLLSLGYVVFFTHLEARFLIQCFPPIFMLAGYGLSRIGNKNKLLCFLSMLLTTLFLVFPVGRNTLLPDISQTPITFSSLRILMRFEHVHKVWLTPYITYLSTRMCSSIPRIQLIYPILGLSSLILSVGVIYLIWRELNLKPHSRR